jgi:hypothetical protein
MNELVMTALPSYCNQLQNPQFTVDHVCLQTVLVSLFIII